MQAYKESIEMVVTGVMVENADKTMTDDEMLGKVEVELISESEKESNLKGITVNAPSSELLEVITVEGFIFDITADGVSFRTGSGGLDYEGGSGSGGNTPSRPDTSEIDKIPDVNAGDIVFITTPTTPTNGQVTIEVDVRNTTLQSYKMEYTTDYRTWKEYTAPFTVSKNGKVYVKLSDASGEAVGKSYVDITNIDKVSPKAFTPSATTTSSTIMVIGKTEDNAKTSSNASSGIAKYYFRINNGSWMPPSGIAASYSSEGIQGQAMYNFTNLTDSTTYSIQMKAVDNAGNEQESSTITATTEAKQHAIVGEINVDYSPTTWTCGMVVVTLSRDNPGEGEYMEYTTDNGTTWTRYTEPIILTQNATINAMIKDKDGNRISTKYTTLEVQNIDTTKPEAGTMTMKIKDQNGTTYTSGSTTEESVYLEAVNGSDRESGHASTVYSVTGPEEHRNVTGPLTITRVGTYKIELLTTDVAGNKSQRTYTVIINKKFQDPSSGEYEKQSTVYTCKPDLTGFNRDYTYYVEYVDGTEYIRNSIEDEKPANWYDYAQNKWANIVVAKEDAKTYFTWMPRYMYKTSNTSDVKFVDTNNQYKDENGEVQALEGYTLPPAFTSEGKELPGIWISKYEMTNYTTTGKEDSKLTVTSNNCSVSKPNGNPDAGYRYQIYVNGEYRTTVDALPYNITGLTPKTRYSIRVVTRDHYENTIVHVDANTIITTEKTTEECNYRIDKERVTVVKNQGAKTEGYSYEIYVDGVYDGETLAMPYEITDLLPNTEYNIKVITKDLRGDVVHEDNETIKTLKRTSEELTKPDLSGFNTDHTFYVYYKDGKECIGQSINNPPPEGWCDYYHNTWANIVVMEKEAKSYFTWIPRYEYKRCKTISESIIRFITTDQTAPTDKFTYVIPGAFTSDGKQLTGYWMSKYEMTNYTANGIEDCTLTLDSHKFTLSKPNADPYNDAKNTYSIYVDGKFHSTTSKLPYVATGLYPKTKYTIRIETRDATGDNLIHVDVRDITTPERTTEQCNYIIDSTKVKIVKQRGSTTSGYTYEVYVNGELNNQGSSLPIEAINLQPNTEYELKVVTKDPNGDTVHFQTDTIITTTASLKELTKPDLSGFNSACTYYVEYDENWNETSTKLISETEPEDWYDYYNNKNANIKTTNNGLVSYFVWVPRYEYKTLPQNNEKLVRFLSASASADRYYTLPGAFTDSSTGKALKGYWMSKYECTTVQK